MVACQVGRPLGDPFDPLQPVPRTRLQVGSEDLPDERGDRLPLPLGTHAKRFVLPVV